MWELDNKEGWTAKNWCFQTVVLENPLDSKEIKPVNPKGNHPKYSLKGLILKPKLQFFGHFDVKKWLIGKNPDTAKDWRQEENGATEDEMVGWYQVSWTPWTWIWANSRRQWRTRKSGMLQSMGLEKVGYNWVTEQQMVFPVVMYSCDSWIIKKSECPRIDAFKLWFWIRLLRIPWTARRSNQSILKEINPKYSLEGLMIKLNSNTLAIWYEELTHWKRPWC